MRSLVKVAHTHISTYLMYGYVAFVMCATANADTGSVGSILVILSDERPVATPPGTVYAWHEQSGACYGSVWAGEWGRLVEGLMPGTYLLYAKHVQRWYPHAPFRAGAQPVTVCAGVITTQAWVTRSALIDIVTCDATSPRLLSNAIVRLQNNESYTMRIGYIHNGRCTLERVPPGEYVLNVVPQDADASSYVLTWHPGVPSRAAAARIIICDNEEITLTTVLCRAQAWASGFVHKSGAPVGNAEITWSGTHGATYAAQTDSNGTYRLALQSGTYFVSASRYGLLSEYYPGVHSATGAIPVMVTNAHDIRLDFDMDYGVTVSGTITNFGVAGRVTVFAFEAHRPEIIDELRYMQREHARTNFPSSDCGAYGDYFISGLTAGLYRICAEEYPSSGFLPIDWGYHISAFAWEDACILTAEHANVTFSNIVVGRGIVPAPLAYVTGMVWDAMLGVPLSGAVVSTAYDRRTTGSDGVCVLPCRSPNVTEMLLAKVGFLSLRTSVWALHSHTVQMARAAMITCRVDAPGELLSTSRMVAFHTGSLSVAVTGMHTESNQFRIYVPHNVPLHLFVYDQDALWFYENSFFDTTLSPAGARTVTLAEGQSTNIMLRLHSRTASLTTTIFYYAGEEVSVACPDIPICYTLDNDNSLTQKYAWVEWNMPPNGQIDHATNRFVWHSDGNEYYVLLGRLPTLPDTTRYGLIGGAGTMIHLSPLPEGGLTLVLLCCLVALRINRADKQRDWHRPLSAATRKRSSAK